MSEREVTIRTAVVTYFPMFIAVLSLVTSIYNGYLNGKFVDIIQRNFGRTEYLRTCKEIIDAYFQVKFRAGLVERKLRARPREWSNGASGGADRRRQRGRASSRRLEHTWPICGTSPRGSNIPGFRGSSTKPCATQQDITRRAQQTVRAGRPAFLRHEQRLRENCPAVKNATTVRARSGRRTKGRRG